MRIRKVRLWCGDLAAAQAFYGELIRLPVASQSADSLSFQTGESELNFCLAKTAPAEYHFAWNIPPNQIQSAREFLMRMVPEATDGVIHTFESWNAEAIYFRDPFGNIAEFIARHDLEVQDHEPFDGCAVLEISEVGIVTSHVRSTVDRLVQTFELDLFRTCDRSDDFQAVGDDHGLFIVVREDRPWFSSELKARSTQVEMTITGAKSGRFVSTDARLTVTSLGM